MKSKVKLGTNRMSVPQLLVFATHVVSKITGNAFFTTPSPSLAKIASATTALQNSYNLAQGAGPQQTANTRQSRKILETLLAALGHYVEDVANDPENVASGAETIILSAGMEVRQSYARPRQIFSVTAGTISGSIRLFAKSVARGSHEWQSASEPAVNEWTPIKPTIRASNTISGLVSGRRYYFRHRIVLPDGPTDWDEPISIIVS